MSTLLRLLSLVVLAVIKRLPAFMIYPFAKLYIAGTTQEQAITLADELWKKQGVYSTIDYLGEDPGSWVEVQAYALEYAALCLGVRGKPHIGLSAKLTGLGQRLSERRCEENALELIRLADEQEVFVRWDMEDHTTTSSTLRIHEALREAGYANTGVVLQTRLFRTPEDLERLTQLPGCASIRLCIGIYPEPPEIAIQDKHTMKRRLLELLEIGWQAGLDIRVASHDLDVVRSALNIARRLNKPMDEVEIQMLYGVPDHGLTTEVQQAGARFRRYIPYGANWRAYCLRRFTNNPDLIGYVVKNFFVRLFGR